MLTNDERIERMREQGVRFLDEPPEGWRRCEGALTAPNGWEWWAHGSLFWRTNGRERYEHALVRKGAGDEAQRQAHEG